jgi:hypothetical protein
MTETRDLISGIIIASKPPIVKFSKEFQAQAHPPSAKEITVVFGCSPEEIAPTRNVTGSLQNVLLGLELKPGDEVLTTPHDDPTMKFVLYQREKRDSIRITPSICMTLPELDMFIAAVTGYVQDRLPKQKALWR